MDYALQNSITSNHGFTLKRRQSRCHPTECLPNLDYADDIALIEDKIIAAQELLTAVEKARRRSLSKRTKNKIHAYQSLLGHTINLL